MRHFGRGLLYCGLIISTMVAMASSSNDKDEAIKKDRKLYEGTWRAVKLEVEGNKTGEEDARKISVVNGDDGTWTLFAEGKQIAKGTSTIDPTAKPKTIDFLVTEGDSKDMTSLGIYEIDEKTRKLCFAAVGKPRPKEFSSDSDNRNILVTFEREKSQ